MSDPSEKQSAAAAPVAERADGRFSGLAARLTVELVIGLGLAAVLLLVAWASSSAIKFVYGGY